jgi:GTP pyrophosphokinase
MATVDRVLPWRRTPPPAEEVAPLLSVYRGRHPKGATALISRAYATAANAHAGQIRNSGEPYIEHPLAVATIVAELGRDDVSIAAALLPDAVEDTAVSVEEINSTFGAEVAAIVVGVT